MIIILLIVVVLLISTGVVLGDEIRINKEVMTQHEELQFKMQEVEDDLKRILDNTASDVFEGVYYHERTNEIIMKKDLEYIGQL